jgi:hypothetical protein
MWKPLGISSGLRLLRPKFRRYGRAIQCDPATACDNHRPVSKIGDLWHRGQHPLQIQNLWHPDLWKPPQTPQLQRGKAGPQWAAPATPPQPTSLFSSDDSNPLPDKGSEYSEVVVEAAGVRNEDSPVGWRQLLVDLQTRRSQQQCQARSHSESNRRAKARQGHQSQREKMVEYLRSGDPILIREGLQWVSQQSLLSLATLGAGSVAVPGTARAVAAKSYK